MIEFACTRGSVLEPPANVAESADAETTASIAKSADFRMRLAIS